MHGSSQQPSTASTSSAPSSLAPDPSQAASPSYQASTPRTSLHLSDLDPSLVSATAASELELVETFAGDQEGARAVLSYTEDGLGDEEDEPFDLEDDSMASCL